MSWLTLLGTRSKAHKEMGPLQCVRTLKMCDNLFSEDAQEAIDRLEWLTGHPDIMTYLQDNPWRCRAPKAIHNDIIAEVRLLNQLIDFTPPE